MDKNKKIVGIVAGLLVLVLIIWAVVAMSSKNGDTQENEKQENKTEQTAQTQADEPTLRPDAKPVFKFFYSASSADAEAILAVVEELKTQYSEQVDFDICDIDANPEYVEQFSVIAPPQLYMLAKNGDFADMKFGTYDKAELEDAIKKTLE